MIRFDMLMQKCYESDLIGPEIENQSKRYPIDPTINMLCDKDPSNQIIKLELANSKLIWSNFPLFSYLRQKLINVFLNNYFSFFSFSCFFNSTDIFWTITEGNKKKIICRKFKKKMKLDTKEFFLRKQQEWKFQKDIT